MRKVSKNSSHEVLKRTHDRNTRKFSVVSKDVKLLRLCVTNEWLAISSLAVLSIAKKGKNSSFDREDAVKSFFKARRKSIVDSDC